MGLFNAKSRTRIGTGMIICLDPWMIIVLHCILWSVPWKLRTRTFWLSPSLLDLVMGSLPFVAPSSYTLAPCPCTSTVWMSMGKGCLGSCWQCVSSCVWAESKSKLSATCPTWLLPVYAHTNPFTSTSEASTDILQSTLSSVPSLDILVIMSDLNAHVGSDNSS